MTKDKVIIATRGSALALAQSNMVLAQCREAAPHLDFELRIIKTTGDKMQTASMAQEGQTLPKGLFTKELEVALQSGEARMAVHSLKDLPTELPEGLGLGAVGKREDVRDVVIYRQTGHPVGRGFPRGLKIQDLPDGAVVATSSTRRKAQLLAICPRLDTPPIRGNVATRMRKIAEGNGFDATVLALAGMSRLKFSISPDGQISGNEVPEGLLAAVLDIEAMLPCVGQGAIGIEVRLDDKEIQGICEKLNHFETAQCVAAERAFLAGMGGGCQSPVAAYAEPLGGMIRMRAVSFASEPVRRATKEGSIQEPEKLGRDMATELRP